MKTILDTSYWNITWFKDVTCMNCNNEDKAGIMIEYKSPHDTFYSDDIEICLECLNE